MDSGTICRMDEKFPKKIGGIFPTHPPYGSDGGSFKPAKPTFHNTKPSYLSSHEIKNHITPRPRGTRPRRIRSRGNHFMVQQRIPHGQHVAMGICRGTIRHNWHANLR
jgi:hypothetical protein